MKPPAAAPFLSDDQAVRDIPRWTARYLHSRTLVIVPMMLLFLAAWAVIAGLSWLAGWAYFSGSPLCPLCAIAAIASCAIWVWVSVTGRLRPVEAFFRRMYASEGEAVPASLPAQTCRGPRIAGILFASAILLTVLSGFIFNWPLRYMQPITAIYSVPFLVYLCYAHGRFAAPLMLLWPALYAIHAALILAGVPLGFLEWPSVSILFPVTVYGIIAAIASHIYGRFALRKLRALATVDETQTTGGR